MYMHDYDVHINNVFGRALRLRCRVFSVVEKLNAINLLIINLFSIEIHCYVTEIVYL